MDVRGPFDLESNELLVWEIEKLQGLRFSHRGDIFFHHPALKLPVRGENTGCVSVPSGAKELEVDADEEPTAAKEQRLIHQPVEGVTFDAQLHTKIAQRERASGHGKKVDDEQCPSRESQLFGVADPVSEGKRQRQENSNNWVRERVMGTSMNGLQIASRCSERFLNKSPKSLELRW